jgi:NAD(P)-dependent dehydrogenase (short-subunit alcohol dehydrogenase family)
VSASLAGHSAVVTGGSGAIGRAIVSALADAGANVAVGYRERGSEAMTIVAAVEDRGRRAIALQLDVTHRGSVTRAAREAEEALGPLTVLVNSAGVNRPADFDAVSDEDWELVVDTNLKGPFVASQVFLPLLVAAGGGSIIHIGSVSGQYGGPRTAHYAASKAGLISLSQVIARFGAPHGVRSNVVAAGLISSEMATQGLAAAAVGPMAERILLDRLGTPEEVAAAVLFLAGDESSYITAQTLNVNGGLYF